jgi:hypothetical protein
MADLKPLWSNPPVPTPGLEGDLATSRGNDPNAEGNPGPDGLQPIWTNDVVPVPGGQETPNSVSGLPSHIDRFTPSGEPPPPPDLTDRNPGTIDQK